MLRAQASVQVEERAAHSHYLRREPDLAADGARPGEGAEAEEQRQSGVVPFAARSPFRLLDSPHQPIQQRDIERGEGNGEGDVVEGQAFERHERHHEDGGKRRERNVPAAVLVHPIVEIGRPLREVQLTAQEGVGLVHEVGCLRLVPKHRSAGERVREEAEDEEREIDAMGAGEGTPAGSAHAFPGGAA